MPAVRCPIMGKSVANTNTRMAGTQACGASLQTSARTHRDVIRWTDSMRLDLLKALYETCGHKWPLPFSRIPKEVLINNFLIRQPELTDRVSFRKLIDNSRTYRARYPHLVRLAEASAVPDNALEADAPQLPSSPMDISASSVTDNTPGTSQSEQPGAEALVNIDHAPEHSIPSADRQFATTTQANIGQSETDSPISSEVRELMERLNSKVAYYLGTYDHLAQRKTLRRHPQVDLSKLDAAVSQLLRAAVRIDYWYLNCLVYSAAELATESRNRNDHAWRSLVELEKELKAADDEVKRARRVVSYVSVACKNSLSLTARQERNERIALHYLEIPFYPHTDGKWNEILGIAKNHLAACASRARYLKQLRNQKRDNERFTSDRGRLLKQCLGETGEQISCDANEAAGYWRTLWQNARVHTESAELTQAVEYIERQCSAAEQSVSPLDSATFVRLITSKPNWKAPGPDKLQHFWWKKLPSVWPYLKLEIDAWIAGTVRLPQWLCEARTVLIPKGNGACSEPGDFRPLSCPNAMYKICTSYLLSTIKSLGMGTPRMHAMQRGVRHASSGLIETGLINRWAIEDAITHKRNLSVAWIDFRKAFDTVLHSWIDRVLQASRFPEHIVRAIRNITRQWSTKLEVKVGGRTISSESIQFTRGILQGDALSPFIFCLCTSPISHLIDQLECGYQPGRPENRLEPISHSYYLDDLKLYCRSTGGLQTVLTTLSGAFDGLGFMVNTSKSGYLHLNAGKSCMDPVCMIQGTSLPERSIAAGGYKYLGVYESSVICKIQNVQALTTKMTDRLRRLGRLALNAKNLAQAVNESVLPSLEYQAHSVDFADVHIKHFCQLVKQELIDCGFQRRTANTSRLFVPRVSGGRGILSPRDAVARAYIRRVVTVLHSQDNVVRTIATCESQTWRQLVRTVQTVFRRIGCAIDFSRGIIAIDGAECDLDGVPQVSRWAIKKYRQSATDRRLSKLKSMPLHGSYSRTCSSVQVTDLSTQGMFTRSFLDSFTEGIIASAQENAVPVRWFVKNILKQDCPLLCRKCNLSNETLEHVLSSCSTLSFTQYVQRHDSMLRPIYAYLRRLIRNDRQPQGICNLIDGDQELLWNTAIETSPPVSACKPDIVYKDRNRILLIEGTVVHTSTLETKACLKRDKYQHLARSLSYMYPGRTIAVIPIVLGTLGGFTSTLLQSLSQLPSIDLDTTRLLAWKMQRNVMISSRRIITSFIKSY